MSLKLPHVILCVDDHVSEFFCLWSMAYRLTESQCPVVVYPFSPNTNQIESLCRRFGFEFASIDVAAWIDIGQKVYGSEYYRPGLPRARFFSKVAVFGFDRSDFIFFDVNAIPFVRPENYIENYRGAPKDILFRWQLSSLGQNIPSISIMEELNALNPSIGRGWSANYFYSKRSILDIDDADSFARTPSLRARCGTAPEQSFLTQYLAHKGINLGSTSSYCDDGRGVSCRSHLWISDDSSETLKSDDGCAADIKAHFVKWNGSNIGISMENYWIVRRIHRLYEERLLI